MNFKRLPALGFTLVELLVVIAIIGLLASLLVANTNGARARGRDTQRKSDIKQMQNALELYFQDNKKYPSAVQKSDSGAFMGVLVTGKYLPQNPVEPSNPNRTDGGNPWDATPGYNYYYSPIPAGCDNTTVLCNDYYLYTRLENASDQILINRNCNMINSAYSNKCYYVQAP